MTKFTPKNKSNNVRRTDIDLEPNVILDTHMLMKRVNALMLHAESVDGETPAENNAREITAHLKNLKEIDARNKAIQAEQDEKAYTRYEDLPAPHPDDIKAYRRRLEDLVTRIAKSGTEKDIDQ